MTDDNILYVTGSALRLVIVLGEQKLYWAMENDTLAYPFRNNLFRSEWIAQSPTTRRPSRHGPDIKLIMQVRRAAEKGIYPDHLQ